MLETVLPAADFKVLVRRLFAPRTGRTLLFGRLARRATTLVLASIFRRALIAAFIGFYASSAISQTTVAGAMSLSEAYRALRESAEEDRDVRKQSAKLKIGESMIEFITEKYHIRFRFRDTPDPKVEECGFFSSCVGWFRVHVKGEGSGEGSNCCNWFWQSRKTAELFAMAFKTLSAGLVAETPEEIASFDSVVEQFRGGAARPEFPEEARRARVQAESAVRDKRYGDAVDRYEAALKIAPWWPEGRFNRAMMLGETERFTEAIREMKKYLALVPEATNARAAQDKIYEWEGKAGSKP